ncbi:MAG: hypothetical protein IT445_01270 [Phycisphaeraceae bacterium]|nr:hypothetical protein [Phycisphaeraceae bacterium]
MMNLISLLALDDIWGEVIAVSIGVIIMVGSALGKALKKKDESNAAGRATKPAQRADLDELAARRRAELMAEAQRRRLQRQQQGRPTPPLQQPTQQIQTSQTTQRPPTMADRLRQARQQAMDQATARAQQRQQQLEAQRQMQQQRARHQASAPHHPQPAPQPQRPPVRPAASRPPQRQPQPRPQPEPRRAELVAAHYEKEHADVHRLVRDGQVLPVDARRAMLDHHSLRQAIIWKEILDKPIALRDLEP